MHEPHNSTSSGRYNQQKDALLVTKIGIPGIRSALLPRPHLIEHLNKATTRELTLVSAPAGFGKSTLLASWAESSQSPVAWLSLDGDEDDPARFWRYILAAIDRVYKEIGESALSLLNDPAHPTYKAVVTVLVNEFATHPGEFVLVLDDYHLIESPAVHESLAFLLEHLPPGMHVVISSRSDPPIPLARLRARGQLDELRAADLHFTQDEAASLLREIWEFNLSEESIASLEERTEGWVTGLHLAALSLRETHDPAQFIQGFTGSHRYILGYLAEEVFKQQPANVQAFLLRTSILERLNAELCEAVLKVEKLEGWNTDQSPTTFQPPDLLACQQMLEYLERENLFLEPLDEQRHWYRYHHLFADLLRARLNFADPNRMLELHRKAAAWHEANELVAEALRHALAAGEAVWAAGLVERHVEEILGRGEGETLRRWLAALPQDLVHSRPRLALSQAVAAFNAGLLQEAARFLENAEQALINAPSEPFEPTIEKSMSMLANVPAFIALLRASLAVFRGEAKQAIELVSQAQTHLTENEQGPRFSVRWNLAQAYWIRGQLAEAERTFTALVAEGREAGELHLMLTNGSVLGRIQRAQGRLDAALRTYLDGLEFAERAEPGVVLSAAVTHVGIAEVLYQRNQLEQALHHANEGISLGWKLVSTQTLASGLVILAWIQQAMGDPVGAREAMEEAYQVNPNSEIIALHNPVPAERVRLSLVQGNVKEAAY